MACRLLSSQSMLHRLVRDRRGAQFVEYLLLLGTLALGALVGARTFGSTPTGEQRELAACVGALEDCASQVEADGERLREIESSQASDEVPFVTTLPSTGTGPDPASAVRHQRPMTVPEANRTLAPLQDDDVADDYAIFLTANGGPPLDEELGVFAPDGPFTSVLTNPVYIFTDDRGMTSYFGLVDGDVVQIDFDSDGTLPRRGSSWWSDSRRSASCWMLATPSPAVRSIPCRSIAARR